MEQAVLEKAQKWLEGNYDIQTKERIKWLIDNDKEELFESFYQDMEFGTGGLRGIMGVGTNRMNIYTVGMATQGVANYLKRNFPGQDIRVAVSHDSRHNSRHFAEHVADIFAANDFTVYLFDSLRPTPELSFAVRELGCRSGVMITASHNPKEYNGYKAYWEDGAQVTEPHDRNIIAEVGKITSIDRIRTGGDPAKINILDERFDERYLDRIRSLSLSPEAVAAHSDLKIVYTPVHGTGVMLVPQSLRNFGFTNIHTVSEQNIIDGDFPTVASPNPEERTTMKMAIDLAMQQKADIVLATDPDGDRIGIALPDEAGEYLLLNGNQTLVLLTYYILRRWSDLGRLDGKQYVVKTIVTSEMAERVAESFGVKYFSCLTGFKYIAEIIRNHEESSERYICGGEESFGFLAGDFVRDKDAVGACSMAAEAAAWALSQGKTLWTLLKELYVQYGFFKEGLVSVVRTGAEGAEEIRKIMEDFRENPPREICGSPVITVRDYLAGESLDMQCGTKTPIDLERSNVLQFLTADQTVVSVRPSGTEPKIKFYFGVREPLPSVELFETVASQLDAKIERMKRELKLI